MKTLFLYLMALLYVAAGIYHFASPHFYRGIMPSWIPQQDLLIYLSGAIEIALGIFLIPPKTRRISAILTMAMLVVFFVVHIQMLLDHWGKPGLWKMIARFLFQFVLIGWAFLYTKKRGVKGDEIFNTEYSEGKHRGQ